MPSLKKMFTRNLVTEQYDRISASRARGVTWPSIVEELDRETKHDNSTFVVQDVYRRLKRKDG